MYKVGEIFISQMTQRHRYFVSPFVYICPSHKLAGVVVNFFWRISYAVIFAEFNNRSNGISEVLSCLNAFMVFVEVGRIPVHLIYNKFSVTLFVLCFNLLQPINVSKF